MNIQKYLELLRDIKDVAFATIDEKGNPQVRIIDVMLIDDKKFYFCTARGKDFYNQLLNNGNVAITGLNKDFQMIRVSGIANKLKSSEQKIWIDRIFEENKSMNYVYPNESRYILEAFCVEISRVHFFDLSKEEIYRETINTYNDEKVENGFFITDSCISCGKCKKICPKQCILEDDIFLIEQEHCLHCGLCYENCPVKAIVKRSE